jgi:ABC-type tungstate transport system substrate-binding protein
MLRGLPNARTTAALIVLVIASCLQVLCGSLCDSVLTRLTARRKQTFLVTAVSSVRDCAIGHSAAIWPFLRLDESRNGPVLEYLLDFTQPALSIGIELIDAVIIALMCR